MRYRHIVSMFLIFVRAETRFSGLIARICGGWSHMAIGFRYSDGYREYFESLFSKGPLGPRPFSDLLTWVTAEPGRRMAVVELALTPDVCARKHEKAATYVGLAGYAEWQLLAMWFFERFAGRHGWRVPQSPRRVVCSEYASRILDPDLFIRDSLRTGHDEVTPGSAWEVVRKQPDVRVTLYGTMPSEANNARS